MNRWYEWDGVDPVGKPRIKEYIVAFYDEKTGSCYDEGRYKPEDIAKVMPYTMQPYCKVFGVFGEKEVYELTWSLPF